MMNKKLENVKWFLTELANQDSEDIESNDIEIHGEDTLGRDGCFTVEITKVAQQAYDEIEQLQASERGAQAKNRELVALVKRRNGEIEKLKAQLKEANEKVERLENIHKAASKLMSFNLHEYIHDKECGNFVNRNPDTMALLDALALNNKVNNDD